MPRITTLSATLPIEPHLSDRLCDLDYPLPYEGDSNRSDEKCGYPGKGLGAVYPQQPLNQVTPTEYDDCVHGVDGNHHECDYRADGRDVMDDGRGADYGARRTWGRDG